MSKYENDSFYEHKFCCFKAEHAEKCLTKTELSILGVLLQKIENNYPNREYFCINQDEPYADKVWELIKQGEKEKQQIKNILESEVRE